MKYHSIAKAVVTCLFQCVSVCINVKPLGSGSNTSTDANLLGGDAVS